MKKAASLKTDYGDINAYTEEAEANKEMFLADARTFLKETQKHLVTLGICASSKVHVNRSGIAGSGEVYGDFWRDPESTQAVHVMVGTSAVAKMFSTRTDQVCILARIHGGKEIVEKKERSWKTQKMGNNEWLDPNITSITLAETIAKMLGIPVEIPFEYPCKPEDTQVESGIVQLELFQI